MLSNWTAIVVCGKGKERRMYEILLVHKRRMYRKEKPQNTKKTRLRYYLATKYIGRHFFSPFKESNFASSSLINVLCLYVLFLCSKHWKTMRFHQQGL